MGALGCAELDKDNNTPKFSRMKALMKKGFNLLEVAGKEGFCTILTRPSPAWVVLYIENV